MFLNSVATGCRGNGCPLTTQVVAPPGISDRGHGTFDGLLPGGYIAVTESPESDRAEDRPVEPAGIEGDRVEGSESYDERDDRLSVYEYIGMAAAGMGFFLTPILTVPVVAYCVYQIWDWKRLTAWLIVGLTITTALFWGFVVIAIGL